MYQFYGLLFKSAKTAAESGFNDGLKLIVLSIDSYEEIKDKLPWSQLGLDETPFIGKALRDASMVEIEMAIEEAVKIFDDN